MADQSTIFVLSKKVGQLCILLLGALNVATFLSIFLEN